MRSIFLGVILAAAATPVLADATSPWSFGGSVGYDIPVDGRVLDRATGTTIALNTLNSNLTGNGAIALRGTDYKDAYDDALRATLEVRYAMSNTSEFFAAFSYTNAEAKDVDVGCLQATTVCGATVSAKLTDYRQYGIEVGYRQWLDMAMLGDAVRPYFAVRGGVVRTDAIGALFKTPTDNLANWRLYKETYGYMIGGDLGATIAISPNAEIGGEVGIRYQTALREFDGDLGAIGLGGALRKSERLSAPVSLRLNAAF
jgi:hypothetical protein